MLVKTLAKVLLGGGAVYVTLDQGIWSTSTQGSNALERVRTTVLPDTSDYLNKVPNAKCINTVAVNSWNSGVEKTFSFLANSPEHACEYGHKTVTLLKDKLA